MKFIKRILFWSTFFAGLLIILLLVLYLLLPKFINEEYLKARIAGYVSERTGFKIRLQNVELMFFPRLHAQIHNTSLSVPEKFAVKVNLIRAYPEILPLLKGEVKVNKFYLDAPLIKIFMPEKVPEEVELFKDITFQEIEKKLNVLLKHISIRETDLAVQIRSAEIYLYTGNHRSFVFDGISLRSRLKSGRLKIALTGKSNICEKISINGQFLPDSSAGEGRIELLKLNPRPLFDYYFPDSCLKLNDSHANIKASFNKEGFLKFSSKFEGEIPLLSFQRNDENLIINARSFSGNIIADKDKTIITIKKLDLVNPELSLAGNFFTSDSLSLVKFDLNGTNVDINTTRRVVLFLEGNSGTAKDIFDVIKGGKVPFINITAKAQSLSELGNIENILIKANILDGEISVPEPSLELESVKGDVTVSLGILEGSNLEGRLGNSTAIQGVLKLGLSDNSDLFYLDTSIHADLSRLPSVLEQVVENKTFLHELSLIKKCEGQADGKLTINDGGGSTHVKVDVSRFNLLVVYERFPTPVAVSGEKFFLDDSMIYFKLTNALCGKSSISDLSAGFKHDKDNSFKILSEKSRIHAKDINQFILSFQSAKTALKNISFPRGTVNLNNLELNGPLFAPQAWSFNTSGKIENLIIDYDDLFKEPVTITSLTFKTPGKKYPKRLKESRVVIEECRIASGRNNIAFNGNAVLSKEKLQIDVNATADFLEWSSIKEFADSKLFRTDKDKKSSTNSFLSGIIKAKVKYFKYGELTFSPVHTDITLGAGNISFALIDADLCGVSLTGIIETYRNKFEFRIFPFARDEKLDSSINCFFNKRQVATGSFSLDGEIFTKGKGAEVTRLLNGTLDFKAKEGRIYQLGFLSKIFAILNLTEIFRGKIPDLVGEGFAYNTITASGKLEKGDFVITKLVIDGASMAIVCTGNIDLNKKNVDLIVLISPFKTVDLIIKYIPLVNRILDGNIISIPFRVTGKLEDPDVIPLS
ncbi:MAG: AsmA-like C-terminal domain-containing protein, partial [Candidatus Firestonebacteria bacterium]